MKRLIIVISVVMMLIVSGCKKDDDGCQMWRFTVNKSCFDGIWWNSSQVIDEKCFMHEELAEKYREGLVVRHGGKYCNVTVSKRKI